MQVDFYYEKGLKLSLAGFCALLTTDMQNLFAYESHAGCAPADEGALLPNPDYHGWYGYLFVLVNLYNGLQWVTRVIPTLSGPVLAAVT
ncbi:hypothetical protein KJY73_09505 [Bowmanella sp. Y26]|uniref:hypothetical protein n=1 Tax=Bowmanella yangjiangensis TaxID=2811230 RepID=UPI001BDD5CD3|nr:hypothetical protein [Bowmanella yangjiangensis]MBT1063808.1 hypothetical protein [Bowmanella yangjiangensis]